MGGLGGGGGVGNLHTQEYHHPGRSALCKFTNNNPFFTYCKVVSNCFLLFITWKTNSEPFRHRRLFQSCFNSMLILLDMALSCGSAANYSLACDSFTLEQYMHTHTHTHTHTHWHTTIDIYNGFNSWNILYESWESERETDRQRRAARYSQLMESFRIKTCWRSQSKPRFSDGCGTGPMRLGI